MTEIYEFDGEEFDTVLELVRAVMRKHPKARGNDNYLEWFIHHKVQDLDMNEWESYAKALSSSTIRRRRREIQEEGELLPDEDTLEERDRAEENERERYSDGPSSGSRGVASDEGEVLWPSGKA